MVTPQQLLKAMISYRTGYLISHCSQDTLNLSSLHQQKKQQLHSDNRPVVNATTCTATVDLTSSKPENNMPVKHVMVISIFNLYFHGIIGLLFPVNWLINCNTGHELWRQKYPVQVLRD